VYIGHDVCIQHGHGGLIILYAVTTGTVEPGHGGGGLQWPQLQLEPQEQLVPQLHLPSFSPAATTSSRRSTRLRACVTRQIDENNLTSELKSKDIGSCIMRTKTIQKTCVAHEPLGVDYDDAIAAALPGEDEEEDRSIRDIQIRIVILSRSMHAWHPINWIYDRLGLVEEGRSSRAAER
jgi:hypothetical protein